MGVHEARGQEVERILEKSSQGFPKRWSLLLSGGRVDSGNTGLLVISWDSHPFCHTVHDMHVTARVKISDEMSDACTVR